MRERKKAGSGRGPRALPLGRLIFQLPDTPKVRVKTVPAIALLYGAVRSVAGWLWSLRKASPNQLVTDPPRGLAIGLITVNQYAGNSQPGNEIRSRRRQHLSEAIIHLAHEYHLGKVALVRALDGLSLPELEQLLDELDDLRGDAPGPAGGKRVTDSHDKK